MEIPPTHFPASRAASVAENCINYQQGTPHKVFLVQTIKQASMEVSPAEGSGREPASTCLPSTPEGLSLVLSATSLPLHPCLFWDSLLTSGLGKLTFLGIADSPGQPGLFVFSWKGRDIDTVFNGHYYKEMGKCSKCGAAFYPFLSETCRTIQKNLKTATTFLIYYSNLNQQNLPSSKQYFFA